MSLCGHRASEAERTTAGEHAVRLLSSKPSNMRAREYIAQLSVQVLALLDSASGDDSPAPPKEGNGSGDGKPVDDEGAKHVQHVAARLVGVLAHRYGSLCDEFLIRPLLSGQLATLVRLKRLGLLLTTSPPPPASLCALLLSAGALTPLLQLSVYAHGLHTREGDPHGAKSDLSDSWSDEGDDGNGDQGVMRAMASEPALLPMAERGIEALLTPAPQGIAYLASALTGEAHQNAPPPCRPMGLTTLASFVTRRLAARRGQPMQHAIASLTAMLLSAALGVLARAATSKAEREQAASTAVGGGAQEPEPEGGNDDDEEEGSLLTTSRTVAAAMLLLESASAEQLTRALHDDPKPALALLNAALPSAVGLSAASVCDAARLGAISEWLSLSIGVIQILVQVAGSDKERPHDTAHDAAARAKAPSATATEGVGAAADVTSLRSGLRELLPMLVAASNAPLLDRETRAKALGASIGVTTLTMPDITAGDADAKSGGGEDAGAGSAASSARAMLREAAEDMVSEHIPLARARPPHHHQATPRARARRPPTVWAPCRPMRAAAAPRRLVCLSGRRQRSRGRDARRTVPRPTRASPRSSCRLVRPTPPAWPTTQPTRSARPTACAMRFGAVLKPSGARTRTARRRRRRRRSMARRRGAHRRVCRTRRRSTRQRSGGSRRLRPSASRSCGWVKRCRRTPTPSWAPCSSVPPTASPRCARRASHALPRWRRPSSSPCTRGQSSCSTASAAPSRASRTPRAAPRAMCSPCCCAPSEATRSLCCLPTCSCVSTAGSRRSVATRTRRWRPPRRPRARAATPRWWAMWTPRWRRCDRWARRLR